MPQRISHLVRLMLLMCMSCTVAMADDDAPYTLTDPLAESWRIRIFEELKGKGLKCIDEGSDGSMWFGTDRGAISYDGRNWREYSAEQGLPSSTVSFAVSESKIYAATRSGIYYLTNDTWSKLFPVTSTIHWHIEDLIADSGGNLWAATNWGALKLDTTGSASNKPILTLYTTKDIARTFRGRDEDRVIAIAIEPNITARWRTGIGAFVYAPVPYGNNIIALADGGPAEQAGLQIGDRIIQINGEDRNSISQNELEGNIGTEIRLRVNRAGSDQPLDFVLHTTELDSSDEIFRPYRIIEGHDGTLWFATRMGRLIALSFAANGELRWTNHSEQYDLPELPVPCIAATNNGIAVACRSTASRVLAQYDGESWSTKRLNRSISTSLSSPDDESILIGSNASVIVLNKNEDRQLSTRDLGIQGSEILLSKTSDGAIWIAAKDSVALKITPHGQHWTGYSGILYQTSSPSGAEWFLTENLEVARRSGNEWTTFDVNNGLMSIPLTVVATRSGDVWAAGSHEGIAATARLRNDAWEMHLHPELSWTVDRRAAFEDHDGHLWFGAAQVSNESTSMHGGVIRFDGQNWKHFKRRYWFFYEGNISYFRSTSGGSLSILCYL